MISEGYIPTKMFEKHGAEGIDVCIRCYVLDGCYVELEAFYDHLKMGGTYSDME